MSKNIVIEGWLTKSPPTKRIWRAKWRRRWFALRQSGELPGQYFLDYYADRNCRRRKGTINLDLCEQVDAGLHMAKSGTGSPKLRGSVFTVRTSSRTYHLEADCEADMTKWVDTICRVCGLRSTEDSDDGSAMYQNSATSSAPSQYQSRAGPYIPISECITGVRDPNSAITNQPRRMTARLVLGENSNTTLDLSENDSNVSEDNGHVNTYSNIGWAVSKTFTKLSLHSKTAGQAGFVQGPPVPPRPPKTFSSYREHQREPFSGPKIQEPTELEAISTSSSWRTSPAGPSSQITPYLPPAATDHVTYHKKLEVVQLHHPNIHYYNVSFYPPEVNRALKPRPASHSAGHIHDTFKKRELRADMLQYLDLDLHASTAPSDTKDKNKIVIDPGKSVSTYKKGESSAYKTVDFLKTEAFNITLRDAKTYRLNVHA